MAGRGRWLGLGPRGEPALFLTATEHQRLVDAARPPSKDNLEDNLCLREESRQRKLAMQRMSMKGPKQKTVREVQEEKRMVAVKEMEEIRAQERKKIIEDCKKKIFYQRDNAKTLNRALLFSEVLREREAQVHFNKYLDDLEAKREARWAEKVKENALDYEKDRAEAEKRRREQVIEFKRKLQEQVDEKEEHVEKEKKMLLQMEQEEMEAIMKEVEEEKCKKKADEHTKKMNFRHEVERNLQEVKEYEEKLNKADILENKLIKIHRDFKNNIDRKRYRKEFEIRKMLEQRANDMAAVVGAIAGEREAKEEVSIRKAIEEKEAEYVERETRARGRRRILEEERRRAHREHLEQEDLRLEREEQMLRLALLQRFKREEVNQQLDKEKAIQRRKVMAENLQYYRKQEELQKVIARLEKEEDIAAVKRAADAWKTEDLKFLQYAEEVIAESRHAGRPLEPLARIVDRYKRKYGMVCTTKIEPLQQSRISLGTKPRPLCPKDCCSRKGNNM